MQNGLLGWPLGQFEVFEGGYGWPQRLPLPRPQVRYEGVATEVSVAADAAANTKGLWTEVLAQSAIKADYLSVHLRMVGTNIGTLTDIGVGPAGAEQVVAANLIASAPGTSGGFPGTPLYEMMPVAIPAGSRIAARVQGSAVSSFMALTAFITDCGEVPRESRPRVETAGADTSDSGGTSVDPGASTGVKGAWAQVVASTEMRWDALILGIGNQQNAARSSFSWAVDIGVGPPGGEVVVVSDLNFISITTNDVLTRPTFGPLPVRIPPTSRVAVRASCSGNDATDRLFDAILYGLKGSK